MPTLHRGSAHRKMEEKHSLDLRALEGSEERFKAKYMDCRAQLAERDEQLLELRSRVTRKDAEIAEMKQVSDAAEHATATVGETVGSNRRKQVNRCQQYP